VYTCTPTQHIVEVNKKFMFCFHSMIVLWCEGSGKKQCEIVVTLAPNVLSVVKFLNAYTCTRCSLLPRHFTWVVFLGPGSLSLLVFVECPQLLHDFYVCNMVFVHCL